MGGLVLVSLFELADGMLWDGLMEDRMSMRRRAWCGSDDERDGRKKSMRAVRNKERRACGDFSVLRARYEERRNQSDGKRAQMNMIIFNCRHKIVSASPYGDSKDYSKRNTDHQSKRYTTL